MFAPDPLPLSCLLGAIPSGAAILDRAGTIVHVNDRMAGMFGRDATALVGMRVVDLYDDAYYRERIAIELSNFDAPSDVEFILPQPDGTTLPVILTARPLAFDSHPP